MTDTLRYRGYVIDYDPPPIPGSQRFAWAFQHEGYDGPEDDRHGNAASVEDAKAAIDEQIEEAAEAFRRSGAALGREG